MAIPQRPARPRSPDKPKVPAEKTAAVIPGGRTVATSMPTRPNARRAAPPITYCIDFARAMLEDAGGLYPFGARSHGSLGGVDGHMGGAPESPGDTHAAWNFAAGAVTGNL